MASFVFTSTAKTVIINIDGKESSYLRNGEVRVLTDDNSGDTVYLFDDKAILASFRDRIVIDLSSDSVDVNGVTSFADAGILLIALTDVLLGL